MSFKYIFKLYDSLINFKLLFGQLLIMQRKLARNCKFISTYQRYHIVVFVINVQEEGSLLEKRTSIL